MPTFEDHFRDLMRSNSLWQEVALAFLEQVPENWENLSPTDRILAGRGVAINEDFYFVEDTLTQSLEPIFQHNIIDKIGELSPVTASDLAQIAIAQLTGLLFRRPLDLQVGGHTGEFIPSNLAALTSMASAQLAAAQPAQPIEFKSGILRFAAFARLETRIPRKGIERFSLGTWAINGSDAEARTEEQVQDDDIIDICDLWTSPTNLALCVEMRVVCDPAFEYEVEAHLYGGCSSNAMTLAEQNLRPIIESLAMTAQLSATSADKSKGSYLKVSELLECTTEEIAEETRQLPAPADYLTDGDGLHIVRTCLTACYRRPDEVTDTLMERLRNATALLAHADQMGSDPLSLSMSYAAIEALVCEKDRNVQQIKEHVPTLLCRLSHIDDQDDKARIQAQEELKRIRKKKGNALCKLYAIRCDVMHGRKVAASRAASETVRRVAASVVRAVVCWRLNQEKVGADTSWEDLISELDAARPGRKNRDIVGVPDLAEMLPDKWSD